MAYVEQGTVRFILVFFTLLKCTYFKTKMYVFVGMRVRFKIRSTKIWITFRMLNYSVSTRLSHLNTCCASIRIHILEMLHSVFLLFQHFKYFYLETPPFVEKIETWIKTNDKISIKWHKNTYNWMGSIVESLIKICHKAYCQSLIVPSFYRSTAA